MAYLGNDLQVAFPVYRNIDDISGSFNSSTTSFPLRVSGVAPVPAPLYSQQCLISVGGVVQRPDDSGSEGFRLSGGNIIFASAPTTGADFFGVILAGADYINAGGNFPSGTAAVPSITFNDDLDTGIYNSGVNQVSITTGGSERLRIDSAGQIESVSLGTAATPAFSFITDPNTGIYSPGADQVAVSTGGSGRLFVDSSGRVGVGTSSPSYTLDVAGSARIGAATGEASLELGAGATGNRAVYIDFVGDTTYTDYGFRIIRTNEGANAATLIEHRGTGDLAFNTLEAAPIIFRTNSSERLRITPAGYIGIGTASPSYLLDVSGSARVGAATGDVILEVGAGASTNRNAGIDFVGDTTYSDYGLRIIRTSDGANTDSKIRHRGTGSLIIEAEDAAPTAFWNGGSERMRITSAGLVGVGTSSPGQQLSVTTASNDDGIVLTNSSTNGGRLRLNSTGAGGRAYHIVSTANGSGAGGGKFAIFDNTASDAARLVIDSSGNIGINNTNPGYPLDVIGRIRGNSGSFALIASNGSGSGQTSISLTREGAPTDQKTWEILQGSAGDFTLRAINDAYNSAQDVFSVTRGSGLTIDNVRLFTSGNERLRIDSSGRLLVGTSSAVNTALLGAAAIQVAGGTNDTAQISISRYSNNPDRPRLAFIKSRSGTVGANTILQDGDNLGEIAFMGADGSSATGYPIAAFITAAVDGTPGANDMPGRLVFSTTADGASSPTERMRITNDGQTYFGITGNTGLGTTNRGFLIRNELAGKTYVQLASTGTTTDTVFYFYNGNGLVGSISMNGSATAYNTSSDYRLKENVAPVPDGITRLQQLKPSRFNFIADPATTVDGFIAHEVQAVVPEAITGEKDAVDDQGNPQYQGIDQSKLVPLLTAALQEAVAKIESLEARLDSANL